MIKTVVTLLFFLLAPAFILRFCSLFRWAYKVGAVLLCYVLGFIIGQTGWLADQSTLMNGLATGTILLALPMLFFEINILSLSRLAKPALLSLIGAILGLFIIMIVVAYLFKDVLLDIGDIGGLLMGVYTGGTANMASIQMALQVDHSMFIVVNTIDVVLSSIYMLLMISIAPRLIGKLLPAFPNPEKMATPDDQSVIPLKLWLRKIPLSTSFKAFGCSLILAAIGAGLGLLVKNEAFQMATIVLTITTLSLIASNIPMIKQLKGSFDTGMYLILIFSIVVASMADFSTLTSTSFYLIGFVAAVLFGSIFLHLLFCKLFKVDTDTMIVTSVALVNSAPFVPVVCHALNNKSVMMSGITIGIIGYAIGNYAGIGMAWLLNWLFM